MSRCCCLLLVSERVGDEECGYVFKVKNIATGLSRCIVGRPTSPILRHYASKVPRAAAGTHLRSGDFLV